MAARVRCSVAKIKDIIKLIRVYQWTKSGAILMPLIFSEKLPLFFQWPLGGQALDAGVRLVVAFAGFSCLASFGYVLNDWKDMELDRRDERKRHRPLASGRLTPATGLGLAVVLLGAAIAAALYLGGRTPYLLAIYLGFNVLFYSFIGKRIILVDVFAIAIGFVLRVVVGAEVLSVSASPWLLSCTFFGALFLGFSKRFFEVSTGPEESMLGGTYRREVLQNFISISAALSIMNYALYCIQGTHANANLIWTVPFVVMGVFRYYVITHSNESIDGNPSDVLLADRFLIGIVVSWVALCAFLILYHGAQVAKPGA